MNDPENGGAGQRFEKAVAIMARLRGADGCPWDREQDFDSIRKHTLEEAYEVLDAIERRDWPGLKDELGDLLLQVLFYAQMADEAGHFAIADIVDGLSRKLVRRHPHVFGDEASRGAGNAASGEMPVAGIDSSQVLRNWEAIKAAERRQLASDPSSENRKPEQAEGSRLGSIPRSMPALMEAVKLGSRAAKSGFDWPDADGLFAKLDEEKAELLEVVADRTTRPPRESGSRVEEELGDLLFTVVNLARHLKIDPEFALRGANAKFRRRFAAMERQSSVPLESLAADELEALWSAAKALELAD